ncbi:conserved oligomeric Golgi complex subunit 3 [Orussus abietinus]|uniref:conserved oligomeric Golgi complex subunit 3 n=1 Tax=Orussus abietinus TaxID=222816 RepID=UPI000625CBAD|nr:conserved oligomeric Golgi complex subunit 3 [Orussus abietinus]
MAKQGIVQKSLMKCNILENTVAPLVERQKELLIALENEVSSWDVENTKNAVQRAAPVCESYSHSGRIETSDELLRCYGELERRYMYGEDTKYALVLEQLTCRKAELDELCIRVDGVLEELSTFIQRYTTVSDKTTPLYVASEQLISDQKVLKCLVDGITERVKYFKAVDYIMEKLNAPMLSVNSDVFFTILNDIDTNMDFIENNTSFRESNSYLVKYKHCQSKAITLIRHYLFNLFTNATESILHPKEDHSAPKNSDATLALFYGRFQTILPKVKAIVEQVEAKSYKRPEYDNLLVECQQHYLHQRGMVLGPSVQNALQSVKETYNGDHCSLVRNSCALLLHASIDEHRLFYQFFSKPASGLEDYLENLCISLYDMLKPFVVNINHLETLAEICCIFRIEMLDEHVQTNLEPLQGFGNVCLQLLHDTRERLIYRAHLYLRSDILNYNPSPGDLAYPDKLKLMEDIAESIREETRQTRLKRISLSSLDTTSSDLTSRNHLVMDPLYQKPHVGNSPADLHGMWYPTVRRTLVCLSRLYRCVDRPVFQSLSQEAITLCVQSVESAAQKIQGRATLLDAELFQIKHLLILREQIAPFQVDFTVKEYSLDFSKVKTAAFSLLEKRSRLFSLSNNALLEFLLESAPQMKEQLIDSRKHVDTRLKSSCQRLIAYVTNLIVNPITVFLDESKLCIDPNGTSRLRQHPCSGVEKVAELVRETLRLIKFKLPSIQQSLQLYLANRETECILFRPIKNNIVATFTQLAQLINSHYNEEELSVIACPLPEQVSVMLSSSSLVQEKGTHNVEKDIPVESRHPVDNSLSSYANQGETQNLEKRMDMIGSLETFSKDTPDEQ